MNNSKYTLPKKCVIGVIHLMPLPGYVGYVSMDTVLKAAIHDITAFEQGGVDAVIVENNYDLPHSTIVPKAIVFAMIDIVKKLTSFTKLPIGVSVLWNDYRAALDIAQAASGNFIRIPVFVDRVKTQYGVVEPVAKDAISYRREIGAEDILLLTDIHVKHAELLSTMSLQNSANRAIKAGSDGVIITGRWTGDPPTIKELKLVRDAIGDFPIIIGSGANEKNILRLLKVADGVIVSTSLKTGKIDEKHVNIKNYMERIDIKKVTTFIQALREIRL